MKREKLDATSAIVKVEENLHIIMGVEVGATIARFMKKTGVNRECACRIFGNVARTLLEQGWTLDNSKK